MDDAVDRISNLPPNVTEHILQCLPLKDAVMTSVLSTYWRYKCALLPQLVLDRPFFRSIQKVKDFDEGYFDNIYSELDHSRDLMMEFCSCLPLVEKLILGSFFLGNFLDDAGHPPEKLNNNLLSKFRELKNLRLDGVLLDCHCSISYLFCLLNMAPKLQTLEIWVVLEDEPAANSITIVGDWFLDHLKSAKIIAGVLTSSHGSALQLIKKILSSSPVLEVMTITARIQPYTKFNIAKELLQCRRASANAEIIFNLT